MSLTAPTLSDIMHGSFSELGQLVSGVTTAGDGISLTDSLLKGKDDAWNQGTAFITYDVGGSGAAPEGEFARITDYVRTSGKVTADFSEDVATGDHYALASRRWSTDDMIAIVNRGLRRLGNIPKLDETLTTAANQTEYTLPAGLKGSLRKVWRLTSTTTDNEKPVKMSDWYVQNGILIFRRQPPSGQVLRLTGMGTHARLSLFGDTLDIAIALERAIAETTYHAYRFLIKRTEGEDRGLFQDANDAADYRDEARTEYPIVAPLPEYKPTWMPVESRRQQRRRSSKYGPYLQ